jgi:Glyoxalase-like domain
VKAAAASLDHLVYAVPDLDEGVRRFAENTGVEPAPGGRHLGRGSANYLISLGTGAYLEIIGPDPDEPEPPDRLPFGIERLAFPKLITWAVAVSDIDTAIAQARARGYDPGAATAMSRRTGDGELLEWRLTPDTILDGGGIVPFLIDWGASAHPTSHSLPSVELDSFSATSPQTDVIERRLAALDLDLAISVGETAQLQAQLQTPRGAIRLS